jgi:uncharacterized protein (DUF433 family)
VEPVEVVVDHEVMSGDPCIAGTRVTVESILVNLEAGYSAAMILAAYPTLPAGSVEAAVRWAELERGGGRRGD